LKERATLVALGLRGGKGSGGLCVVRGKGLLVVEESLVILFVEGGIALLLWGVIGYVHVGHVSFDLLLVRVGDVGLDLILEAGELLIVAWSSLDGLLHLKEL
jgi:hypothetical protein